ncbi:hypothetical protein BH24DEI2_BH24DEI2_21160 [soil metagenome]
MPVTFSSFLTDEAFDIKNRRDLKAFYDRVKADVAAGELTLEGHTLPTTLNAWLTTVEGDDKRLSRDVDVVNFSLADDKKLAAWKKVYFGELNRALAAKKTVYASQEARELLEGVQGLERANANSLNLMNGNKDDLVSGLSDLQGAVYLLLGAYDGARDKLKLPARDTPLESVKVRQGKVKTPVEDTPDETKVGKPKKARAARAKEKLSSEQEVAVS